MLNVNGLDKLLEAHPSADRCRPPKVEYLTMILAEMDNLIGRLEGQLKARQRSWR